MLQLEMHVVSRRETMKHNLHHRDYVADEKILILFTKFIDCICNRVCIMVNYEGSIALLWRLEVFVGFQFFGLQ